MLSLPTELNQGPCKDVCACVCAATLKMTPSMTTYCHNMQIHLCNNKWPWHGLYPYKADPTKTAGNLSDQNQNQLIKYFAENSLNCKLIFLRKSIPAFLALQT